MDLSGFSITELIELYSQSIQELKNRRVLRTNNVIGDLGEYLVLDKYARSSDLPTLSQVPVGTQNINAIGQDGKRYAIKSTSGHVTGVFYGLEPPESKKTDIPLFEYVIICKFDDSFMMQAIYQLDWAAFLKHRKWHSRMKAWNLTLTQNLIADAKVIFERQSNTAQNPKATADKEDNADGEEIEEEIGESSSDRTIIWEKSKGINHSEAKEAAAQNFEHRLGIKLRKLGQSRYESSDKTVAVFVMSAKFSEKNKEYWYSIADENIPWLRDYPQSYILFVLGSAKQTLQFTFEEFEAILSGCLRTEADPEKDKNAHFHIAFSPEENGKVFFKKKKPDHEYVDVSNALM